MGRGAGEQLGGEIRLGENAAGDRLQALRYSGADTDAITQLVFLHLRFHTYSLGWTDSAVRRYVRDELNEQLTNQLKEQLKQA